ncbi:MAG: hypothetical protein IH936_12225 [Acidobacteria bacterium]|nr:hypothetical protein [Acidobacteriota bacterium]
MGVSRPAPWKAAQFEAVDLASVQASTAAALRAGVEHFVYVSVAHPAPVMKAYWRVRARCEEVALEAGLRTTLLRPWYVLGPGHRWPLVLQPLLALFERLPATRATARRLGFVKLSQMIDTLV